MSAFAWAPLAFALLMVTVADEATQKDYAKLEGVWSFSQVAVDGKRQPPAAYPANKMIVLKDGRYFVVQGPRITFGMAKLDASTSPKQIDASIVDGPAKGQTFHAIYDLNGDTYRFCGSLRSKERATAFTSAAGSANLLHVMKREKQMAHDALVDLYRKELTGTWQATHFEREGEKATDEQLQGIQVVIDGDGNTKSLIGGKVFLAGPATIDPTQQPMTIDVTYTEGDNKGKTSQAIFKLEDGTLTICRAIPGKSRPKEFATAKDSGSILISYKKATADAAK